MKTNELRQGNLINHLGKMVKVTGVVNDYIFFEGGSCFNVDHMFKPIDLTEEILLKCGFE